MDSHMYPIQKMVNLVLSFSRQWPWLRLRISTDWWTGAKCSVLPSPGIYIHFYGPRGNGSVERSQIRRSIRARRRDRGSATRRAIADAKEEGMKHLPNVLNYDPISGIFTWLVNRGRARKGAEAGWLDNKGYVRIEAVNRTYMAH